MKTYTAWTTAEVSRVREFLRTGGARLRRRSPELRPIVERHGAIAVSVMASRIRAEMEAV